MLMSALLLSSCAKVSHVQEENEIALSPFGTSLTKADPTPLGPSKEFGVFSYYAGCQGGTPWNDPQIWAEPSVYFSNACFKYSDGSWGGYPDPYYWPLDGSLIFAGYCPHISVSGGTVTSVNLFPNIEESNPYLEVAFRQKTNPAEMVDLLWFSFKDVAAGNTIAKSSDPISVHFKHALSKVSFAFVDANRHYTLSDVTLEGVVNEGTFYSANISGWMPNLAKNTLADYSLPITLDGTKPAGNVWNADDLLVIPQYLDGIFPTIGEVLDSGVDVVLAFTVEDGFGSQRIELLLKNYTERWEFGKSYQYTITVNSDAIDFGVPSIDVLSQVSIL